MFRKLPRRPKLMSADQAQLEINELTDFYLPIDLNHAFEDNKKIALKRLTKILTRTKREDLQQANIKTLLHCSLVLLYYHGMRMKLNKLTSKYWYWCRQKQFVKSESAFQKTMDCLLPERSAVTIRLTLEFFADVHLWPYEAFVRQILEIVLHYSRGGIALFNMMLTDLHVVLAGDVTNARHRMRVLYDLLKSDQWIIDKQILLPFVTRLLDFFAHSITKGESKMSGYRYLKKGFEVCLRRIFERAENQHRLTIIITMLNWFSMVVMNDDNVLDFSSLLEYAAELYQVGNYNQSFCHGLLEHILEDLVGSPNPLFSVIGCRLLQKMLDRQSNASYILLPAIYFEYAQVDLKVGQYESSDKSFLRHNREIIHKNIVKAVTYHCTSAVNLNAVVFVLSCIILEVPCGLTAAAVACLLMEIQDFALNGENVPTTSRYWLHAIVVSTMSLICWVHKTSMLYRYVNQVIARRAKEAPQLNPPLMESYKVLNHHITWNKPTLFFEDWELRYGLWKHFQDRTSSKQKQREDNRAQKKRPTLALSK